MRIALIAIGEAAEEGTESSLLAGRSLVHHQLDFALAQGCERAILLGDGASREAIALRHSGEAAGAQVQVVRGMRDLPAAVRGDDQLLVLAHGLLPDSRCAFDLLNEGAAVLVLPAEAGWSAGFERLDLTSAWGGAMVLPGRLVAGLDQLPEDAEPIAGLLRLARQAGVTERPLPEAELAEGRWQIVRTSEAAHAIEPAWLRRRLPAVSPFRPTTWLSRLLVRRFGLPWLGSRWTFLGFIGVTGLLLAGALAAAWYGFATLAFAALVPAALAIEADDAFRLLARSLFRSETGRSRASLIAGIIWDAGFVVVGVLAIDGSRAHRLFAPLVAAGLLRVPPAWPETGWRALAADRGMLAVIMVLAAGFGASEAGLMLVALLLIAVRLALPAGKRD